MIQPIVTPRKEIPNELLSVILSLAWSVQPQKRGSSQIRFWWPPRGQEGSTFRAISTGIKSDKVPKDLQTDIIAQWFLKEGFTPARKAGPGEIGLESECEEYIQIEYVAKGHPEGTIRPIRQALRRLCEVLTHGIPEKRIRPVAAVPEITMEAFHAAVPKLKLREKPPRAGQSVLLKPKGWKNLFNNVRAFVRWEMGRTTLGVRHLIIDPTLGVETPTKAEIKKSRPIRTEWPDAEFSVTLANIKVRVQRLKSNAKETSAEYLKDAKFTIKLFRYGGVDVNDSYRLLAHQIEEDGDGKLWIKKLRGKAKITSGVEMIKLPVSSKIEKELREYWVAALAIGQEAHVLPWHKRFKSHETFRSWVWKIVQIARARAGLPKRDVKSLRHTFVTYHLKRGKVTLRQLREWLGHADDSKMIEDTYDLSEYGAEEMD
ncbi:MAG: site-specific integrase [Fibrobacteria bacterium]